MIWTSKCRMPSDRLAASRTAANASKTSSLRSSPLSSRSLNSAVLPIELGIGQSLELRLERRDVRGLLGQALHAAPLAHAKDLL